ncbi:MAG: YkgJ family cysteine cluster protein [Candidatus Magnetobacterium sp. LHC-1]
MAANDLTPFIDKLGEIYQEIDGQYAHMQGVYNGFGCDGCDDNCCTTVFYHYTLIEEYYLFRGLAEITDQQLVEAVLQNAETYRLQVARRPHDSHMLRLMCPVNHQGRCIVYEHRPLICRIHGVAAVLHSPTKGRQQWDGCQQFVQQYGEDVKTKGQLLDRTPFYSRIATLEKQLREELVYVQKVKKTIADMIVDFANG